MLRTTSLLTAVLALSTFACSAEPSSSDDTAASTSDITQPADGTPDRQSPLVIIHLPNYENFFSSADAYENRLFNVSYANVQKVAASFEVDRDSLGMLVDRAPEHFATVGVRFTVPEAPFAPPPDVLEMLKQRRLWTANERNFALELDENAVQLGTPAVPGVPAVETTSSHFRDRVAQAFALAKSGSHHVVIVNAELGEWAPPQVLPGGPRPVGSGSIQETRRDLLLIAQTLEPYLSIAKDVTLAIVGDGAHLPNGRESGALNATVIGPRVRTGTTGRISTSLDLPPGTPSTQGLWAYLADVTNAPASFGKDPHAVLVDSATPAP